MRRLAGFLISAIVLTFGTGQPAAAGSEESTHIVKSGETLWAIASMHGVVPDIVARANALPSPDRLQIGQRLGIPVTRRAPEPFSVRSPPPASRIYVVQEGDTLWSIAQQHGLSVDRLVTLNRLASADRLQIGQPIVLGHIGSVPPVRRVPGVSTASPPVRPRALAPPAGRLRITPRVAWPSRGIITSRFGPRWKRHHHGIDIAAPVGTPITAALDGVVEFKGRLGGYGLLVILDSGNGLTTWYGHTSQILVAVGQRVRQGQLIARVGTTGYVTGPNLHFEVRKNRAPLDPMQFLRGAP